MVHLVYCSGSWWIPGDFHHFLVDILFCCSVHCHMDDSSPRGHKQTNIGRSKTEHWSYGKKQKSRYTFVAWLSPLQNAHKGRSIVHCVIFVSVASTQNILDWKEQQLLLMFWLPPLFVGFGCSLLALQKPVHTMSPTSPRALRTMHRVLGGTGQACAARVRKVAASRRRGVSRTFFYSSTRTQKRSGTQSSEWGCKIELSTRPSSREKPGGDHSETPISAQPRLGFQITKKLLTFPYLYPGNLWNSHFDQLGRWAK